MASIRYLQVHGTWEGTWLAYGSLPIRTTLHLGQDGSSVHGTLWMNVAGAPFNFQIRGVAAQDDGTGVGSFTWSASDPSGRIDGSMTLVGSTLSGTLTLSAADDSIGGPVTLFRTGAEPGSLVSSASSGDLRWAGRRLAGIAP